MDIWERIMLPESWRIPILGGWHYRLLSKIARHRIRKIKTSALSLNKDNRETILTCTLTSFPDRIDSVQYTIKSLFSQTVKPDRIVLWLAQSEFEGVEMPESIKELQRRGLEVRYCDNFFGHKRYYKLVEEQRENECIIMFDDDIIFPPYLIERLYTTWKKHPDCVVCERGQLLTFDGDKLINPGLWSSISKVGLKTPSSRILASPGGGCLFPPHSLYKDACDTEIISKYALKTGDLWLMFMTIMNNTKIVRTHQYHRIFILSEKQQTVQLGREAIYNGRYMQTLYSLIEKYPHAYDNMIKECKDF